MQKIMFNDAVSLTEATLHGRKTNTRRDELTKEQQGQLEGFERQGLKPVIIDNHIVVVDYIGVLVFKKKTRYKVGEIVAVAQSYKDACVRFIPEEDEEFGCHEFPAEQTNGWNNKMYVRASRMPHHIRITDIRIDRLQDISDEDCMKEGITYIENSPFDYYGIKSSLLIHSLGSTPREAFAALIGKVSGKGTWERNPYVVVYDYELVK